jgi:hypothetical protein
VEGMINIKEFKLKNYDCVDDIVQEALLKLCGVKTYYLADVLKSDIDTEFVCGTMSYVRKARIKIFCQDCGKTDFGLNQR